tara:strand:- start:320 stop:1324 length:1005 start_codon:yes stop_codon:yes gene_type:complete
MKINNKIFVYAIFWSFIYTIYPWVDLLVAENFSDHWQTIERFSRTRVVHNTSLQSFIFEEFSYEILMIKITDIISFFRPEIFIEKRNFSFTQPFPISNNVELSIQFITFYILLVWTVFLFKRMAIIPAILLLLHPVAIDMHHSIYQTSLAFTLIIIGSFSKNKIIHYLLIFIAPLIHNSAFLLTCIILINNFIVKKLIKSKLQFFSLLFGTAVVLFLCIMLLSYMVEDGSATVAKSIFTYEATSIVKVFFYCLILCMQLLHSKDYLKKHYLIVQTLILIVPLSFFTPFAFRFAAGLWPLFVYSVWDMSKDKRIFALALWIINLCYVYLVWTSKI